MKNKVLAILTALLLGAIVQPLEAQTFKAGDYVDVQAYNQWIPGRVKQPVYYGLGVQCPAPSPACPRLGAYIVTYVTNAASGPQDNMVALTDIRARAATAEDKRTAVETSGAMARQQRGSGVGTKYGTRDPRPCGARTAPANGAPTAEQARQYVTCEMERGDGLRPESLITNLKVQVASVSHPPNQIVREITAADMDPRQPIWDIRGSYTIYRCFALASLSATNDFARTHNCWMIEQPTAKGYCYKDTFGDWHCGLLGSVVDWRPNMLPPEGY